MTGVQILAGAGDFLLSNNIQAGLGANIGCFCVVLKWPGFEADHLYQVLCVCVCS
jgi:hypothetical protein